MVKAMDPGKTSMLNIICSNIPAEAGKILINGEDIARKKYKKCKGD
ncbi:MAG: hypothetical protein ACLTLQ_08330 [[Clostridium] scindens]